MAMPRTRRRRKSITGSVASSRTSHLLDPADAQGRRPIRICRRARHGSDTTMYTAKDYDRALLSPSSVFDQPMDVVATDSMTARQKLEVLKRWELEARQLDEATGENMSGGESSPLPEV